MIKTARGKPFTLFILKNPDDALDVSIFFTLLILLACLKALVPPKCYCKLHILSWQCDFRYVTVKFAQPAEHTRAIKGLRLMHTLLMNYLWLRVPKGRRRLERRCSNSRNHLDLATLEGGIGFEWGQEDGLEEQRGAYAP
jgi:hypothetical protein